MLRRLSKRCSGGYQHQHLVGGRAANASFYPTTLVLEILRGMPDEADSGERIQDRNDAARQNQQIVDTMSSTLLCEEQPKNWEARYADMAIVAKIKKKRGQFKLVDGSV